MSLCRELLIFANIGPRGLLGKVLYGEAPPGGLNSYPSIYYFQQNGTPFKDKPKQ